MEKQIVAQRYEVIREIARGGMGSVHEAVHLVSKKRVALKLLFPTFDQDAASKQRFLREASVAAQIGHEGIVEVYDAGIDEADGTLFVAMELLIGETVRDRIERGNISLPEFFSIFLRTLDPIAAAHQRGIIHRDLKPENVFIVKKPNGSEVIKILDFGIARDLEAQQQSMTQTGTAMGTPHYMAPEQAMSARGVVATADVWALGAMMYEVVTGNVPFDGETASAVIVHVCVQPLRSLAEAAPGVPGPLAALIERCLSKDAPARPADAGALLAELQQVAAQLGVAPAATVSLGAGGGQGGASGMPSSPGMSGVSGVGYSTPMPGGFAQATQPASPSYGSGGMPGMQQGYPTPGAMPGAQHGYPTPGSMPGAQQGYPPSGAMPGAQQGYPPPGQFGTYSAAPVYVEPPRGSNTKLVVGAVAAAVLAIGTGVGGYFAFGDRSDAAASAVAPGMPGGAVVPGAPGAPGVPGVPPVAVPPEPPPSSAAGAPVGLQTFSGTLEQGDSTLQSGEFADSYTVQLAAGQRFRARVHSEKLDPYLIVRSPVGVNTDNDDENAQTRDAYLELVANEAGTWTFMATTFRPGETGDYQLSLEILP